MTSAWITSWFGSHTNLKNNRWEPAADELAIYFNASELKGLATKTLRIPSGCEARVLADNQVKLLDEGEETLENLWDRINSLFAGKHAEILITRKAALSVPFSLSGLLCGDLKPIDAQLVLRVQVGDTEAFHNHFMRQPGAVRSEQLQNLLTPALRQGIAEFSHKYSRNEVLGDAAHIRQALAGSLDTSLKALMAEFGLVMLELESLQWHFEPSKDEIEEAANATQRKEAWQRYQQGSTKREEAEYSAALRERDIELLRRVETTNSREQAIRLDAADTIAALESDYRANQRAREQSALGSFYRAEDEKAEWEHLKALAAIRRDGLEQVDRERKQAEMEIAREQSRNELQKLKILAEIDQSRLYEDEKDKQASQARCAEALATAHLRDESLAQSRHQIDIDTLKLEADLKRQEKLRVQVWEQAQLESRIACLQAETAEKTADANLSGLRALIKLDDEDERYEIARADLQRMNEIKSRIFEEKEKLQLKLQDEDASLARELKRSGEARQAAAEVREHEIIKANVFGSLPPEALAAMVDDPQKLQAIKQIFMIRNGLAADQIRALNNESPAPTQFANSLSASQAESAVGDAVSREVQQLLERWRADDARQWDRFDRMHSEGMSSMETMGEKISKTAIEMARALAVGQAVQPAPAQQAPAFAQATVATTSYTTNPMPQSSPAPSPVGMKVCRCGSINAQAAKFCADCGSQLGS